ncbi:MAG: hypothetical protein IT427_02730 [Pirellulales bacterium]|nr:hypothetical protein [Pirellulales bacterium]
MPHAKVRNDVEDSIVNGIGLPFVSVLGGMVTLRAINITFFASVRLLGALAILSVVFVSPTHAGELKQPPTVKSVRVGFGNTYKLGCWTPVEISLSESPGQGRGVEIQAADGDSIPVRFSESSTVGSRVFAYANIGRGDRPIDVLLRQADRAGNPCEAQTLRTLASDELPRALPATNEWIVELGATIGFVELAARARHDNDDPAHLEAIELDRSQWLPDQWYGYEGIDVVAIAGTPGVQEFFADPASIDALEHWVRLGGTLLIACGEETELLFSRDRPLSRFAPGEFGGMGSISSSKFGTIETFAGTEGKVERLNATTLHVPIWNHIDGRVKLRTGSTAADVPLVILSPLGFGEVVFVGLDLHGPIFSEWPSRGQFMQRLLGSRSQRSASTERFDFSRGMQLGYVDLSGQLRGALDQFGAVGLIPFWVVATLALVYIAILFPLNYWLATRWLKRPQVAWLVFLLVAAAFSASAYGVANASKGERLWINQIDLVDIDSAEGTARGTTWFNVFSPRNAKFDLQVRVDGAKEAEDGAGENRRRRAEAGSRNLEFAKPLGNQTPDFQATRDSSTSLISWLGLTGAGVGGMNSKAGGAPLFDAPYEIQAGQGRVVGAPIGIWTSKAFVARWQDVFTSLEADLSQAAGGGLHGSIANHSNTSLTECVLMFGNSVWSIGKIEAGETRNLDRLDPQSAQQVDSYLTQRELYSTSSHTPPYDRSSFDVARILEIMMLHEAAGGTNYSGLLHRQQRYVDLSNQLEFGRAILIGRVTTGAAVAINGEDVAAEEMNLHYTVRRYVMPVKAR